MTDLAGAAADATRFWSKVDKTGPRAPRMDSECWLWRAGVDRKGYGRFGARYAMHFAHRFSWALTHGDPGALLVCHRCDVPACVRPDHLFLGTHLENVRDMDSKGRRRTVTLRGADHPNKSLTEADVREARKLKADGLTYDQLAARFPTVCRATIAHAVSGRNWAWLK